jgi:RNA polymerase sigma-70 factor (ECF subfamily)
MSVQDQFIEAISESKGVIFKVIRLYVDDREDEKDLYQEILYQAWRSYPNFKGNSKFSTWLYKVALNTVLTFKRKPIVNVGIESVTDHSSTDGSIKEDVDLLYHAIRSLTEIDRMIISMHLDGYENEEIAEVSGLTKNHVGVKLFRIKEALASKLK